MTKVEYLKRFVIFIVVLVAMGFLKAWLATVFVPELNPTMVDSANVVTVAKLRLVEFIPDWVALLTLLWSAFNVNLMQVIWTQILIDHPQLVAALKRNSPT